MTEAEWLDATELAPMLIHLRGAVAPEVRAVMVGHQAVTPHGELWPGEACHVSEGRLRRFARQCCRLWWNVPLDETSQGLVLAYQRFLDGGGNWGEVAGWIGRIQEGIAAQRRPLIHLVTGWWPTPHGMWCLTESLVWATACHRHRDRLAELERQAVPDQRFRFFGYTLPFLEGAFVNTAAEARKPLPALLREVVGNPFGAVPALPAHALAWNDGAVLKMAKTIDTEEAFSDLPLLTDALLDAGCTDEAILSHLRLPGPHVRGCWALDLVLGKQ
jgi:hypothetical protein